MQLQISQYSSIFTKINWVPEKKHIFKMGEEELEELKLTHVLYFLTKDGELNRLSFGFSNGSLSPPTGTYYNEPTLAKKVQSYIRIGKLEFKIYRETRFFWPCSMRLYSQSDLKILDISSHVCEHKHVGTELFHLGPDEKIVSISVETNANVPLKLTFLLYSPTCT